MPHPNVYALSRKYGPPKINLQEAQIIDLYGETSFAIHPVKHSAPEDVLRKDLDFYPHVWPFIKKPDLLFYLYPVALQYEMDRSLLCINSYLFTLDSALDDLFGQIVRADRDAVIEGIAWMWEAGGPLGADWVQCRTLQKAIGVKFTREDRVREWRKPPPF